MALTRKHRVYTEADLIEVMEQIGWDRESATKAVRGVLSGLRVWMMAMTCKQSPMELTSLRLPGIGFLRFGMSRRGGVKWYVRETGKLEIMLSPLRAMGRRIAEKALQVFPIIENVSAEYRRARIVEMHRIYCEEEIGSERNIQSEGETTTANSADDSEGGAVPRLVLPPIPCAHGRSGGVVRGVDWVPLHTVGKKTPVLQEG